jgi:hypothetical protein
MKGASHALLALMILTVLLSASCGSGSSSPGENCINGDCVTVAVTEPIRLNQPVKVTVTIKTKEDRPEAAAGLDVSDPGVNKIEGEHNWKVSTKAGQTYTFTSRVRFTHPGYYDLIGILAAKVGYHQQSSIIVHVTETGGEVVPPGTKFDTHGTAVPVSPLPLSPNPETSPSPFVSPLPKPASSPSPFASPLATPKSPPPSAAPVWTPVLSPTPVSSSVTATAEPVATPKSPPPSPLPGVIPTLPLTPVSSLAPAEPVATLTSNSESLQPSQSPAEWVTVESQGWEGAFSNWGTVKLNGVSTWGLSTYRAHSGNIAVWPGGEQPDPALGYANNEHTRLQYGPF